jgi:hypothetical protein
MIPTIWVGLILELMTIFYTLQHDREQNFTLIRFEKHSAIMNFQLAAIYQPFVFSFFNVSMA